MKAEYVGQSLLAVVIGIGGYQFLTRDRAEPSRSIPAPSYVAPAPTIQDAPAAPDGRSRFVCFVVHLKNGESASECHANLAECQARSQKAKAVISGQGEMVECRESEAAYLFAIKDGSAAGSAILAQRTMADCEWRRQVELKSARPDDVSPCMGFASPDELKD